MGFFEYVDFWEVKRAEEQARYDAAISRKHPARRGNGRRGIGGHGHPPPDGYTPGHIVGLKSRDPLRRLYDPPRYCASKKKPMADDTDNWTLYESAKYREDHE